MRASRGKRKKSLNGSSNKQKKIIYSFVTATHLSSRIILPIQTSSVMIIQDDLGSILLSAHSFRIRTDGVIITQTVPLGHPEVLDISSAEEQRSVSFSVTHIPGPKTCSLDKVSAPTFESEILPPQTYQGLRGWQHGISSGQESTRYTTLK